MKILELRLIYFIYFRPEWGGAECEGDSEELKLCKTEKKCWESPFSDVRANICSKLTSNYDYDAWLPYESDEGK